jgi:hypothetical protein
MGFVHIAPDGAGIFKARRLSPETKLAKYELEKAMPTGLRADAPEGSDAGNRRPESATITRKRKGCVRTVG